MSSPTIDRADIPTPRTDAAEFAQLVPGGIPIIASSVARQLERELALAKTEAKVFREAFDHITMHMQISESEQMAHMPLNEFIGHASVDDARYWDAD